MSSPIPWNVVVQHDVSNKEFFPLDVLVTLIGEELASEIAARSRLLVLQHWAAIELDEIVRCVVGQQASQLDSVRFHKDSGFATLRRWNVA